MDKNNKSYWRSNNMLPKTAQGTGISKSQKERICSKCKIVIKKGDLFWTNKIVFCKQYIACMSCRQKRLDEL